ncbi:aminotransferase class III-fold pyridoxal phosphate-dependent enzyme [Halorubrum sp. CBA1125]|uniref:class-III pyridoxal-phosphate-dependent aminotransferase n=1 Tax=Halorubrum sp. CBA1125 TaxID=2668072 RepID=UPI0012E95194|nr:aminotransferase class III-fold pyridoxal phosphate-dependent enzyme [Halorubrum sp. CBA1125]MUW14026.1 aminotransferase class III-fold pyridoxal phosphate-dependent enzyme [Halorubrum sp. CBA1125]
MDRDTVEPQVDSFPGEKGERWIGYHRQFAAPSTAAYEFVWDVTEEALGPFCTDVDGNVLLDFTSHIAAAPLGYNNPVLEEKIDEFDLPTPTKIAGQSFYSSTGWPPESPDIPGIPQLMDRLTDLTSDYGLDTVFLSNTGAEAVENAIKICYDHGSGARQGITFKGGFHGRTLGALSLNRSKSVHRRGFPEISGIHDVPYCKDRGCTPTTCDCGFFQSEDDMSLLREMLDSKRGYVDPADLAYIIVEPVQGEGGYRFPSDAFAEELHAVCEKHNILLIVDEIQTGLGRTGEWWGSDHYPFEPDVITSAKASQVGATISRREVFPEEKARISSTWGGGDVLAALQAAVTIDVIEEESLLRNARDRGEQLKDQLREADLDSIENIRGKGLMVALDFESKAALEQTIRAALDRGLLTLGCGQRSMRLLPPLDVTEREIELGANLLVDAIEDTEAKRDLPTDSTTTT